MVKTIRNDMKEEMKFHPILPNYHKPSSQEDVVGQDTHVESLESVNVNLFADVIKNLDVKRSSWIIWVGPKSNHKCPYRRQKRKDTDAQKRRQCIDRGRDWSDMVTNHRKPRNADCSQNLEEAQNGFLPLRLCRACGCPHIP